MESSWEADETAVCAKCGRQLGVGGKRVQKSQELVTATVGTLRRWQQEALEDGLASGVDSAELQTFSTDIDRMIQLGERFAEDLHTVSHHASVPLVDYSLLKRWMDNALELLKP
jgi:hypothetical protein